MPASTSIPDLHEGRLVRNMRQREETGRLLDECEARLDRINQRLDRLDILAKPRPHLELVKGGK